MVEIHYSLASSKATITSAKGRCSQAVATIYTGKVRCTSINGRNLKIFLMDLRLFFKKKFVDFFAFFAKNCHFIKKNIKF